MANRIVRKKIGIEKQVDDFLDQVSESGLLFQQGVDAYLKGNRETFCDCIEQLVVVERKGDTLRRALEEMLYRRTLIPESRGDVLELLENMDSLLDRFKGALFRFDIEWPEIGSSIMEDFKDLVKSVVESVESVVRSARAFFKDLAAVADHMHKVSFWESESDRISTRLQRTIFRDDSLGLSRRLQLRDLVRHVDKIADKAEDVADRLAIYVIKRSL